MFCVFVTLLLWQLAKEYWYFKIENDYKKIFSVFLRRLSKITGNFGLSSLLEAYIWFILKLFRLKIIFSEAKLVMSRLQQFFPGFDIVSFVLLFFA
jgi:hypothetical protein